MRSEYVSKEVLEVIMRRMSPENALAVRLSLTTGLRIGDCLKVRINDLADGNLFYIAEKTLKPGVAHIGAELENELRLNSRGSVFCFPGKYGDKPRTRQTVYADIKKRAKELKIDENVTPHTARKVFAVEELKNKSFDEVQKELQHSDPGITMLYACSDRLGGLQPTSTQNNKKVQKTALLTPKLCEICPFSVGLEEIVDIVVARVLRALG